MSQLISKTEDSEKVVYVFIADGQQTETRFEITKTNPPTWKITPPSELLDELTWVDLIRNMDIATSGG